MKVLFILGNAAVGKMTTGQALAKITHLKLFHNHMTIEPVIDVFGYFDADLITKIRALFFEFFAKTDMEGLIFTLMLAFDYKEDLDYLESIKTIFLNEKPDTQFYHVELVTNLETRIARNQTENRLNHKPSKRDIEASLNRMLMDDQKARLESYPGEITLDNYLKIDNTNMSPQSVATLIKETFKL